MYRRILVAIDNSHGTPHVLDEALKLAGLHPAELHLVTVVNLLELAVEDPRQHEPAQLAALADQHGHTVLAPARRRRGTPMSAAHRYRKSTNAIPSAPTCRRCSPPRCWRACATA